MLHNIKNSCGFTLIEVLVSAGILALTAGILMGSLYTILSVRSKQQSIESSTSSVRVVLTTIANAIETAATSPTVSGNSVSIKGTPCRTIRLTSGVLEQATLDDPNCTLPLTSGFAALSPPGVTIATFNPVKNPDASISISLAGTIKDSFGSHDFNFQTTVTPRVTL